MWAFVIFKELARLRKKSYVHQQLSTELSMGGVISLRVRNMIHAQSNHVAGSLVLLLIHFEVSPLFLRSYISPEMISKARV